MKFASGLAIALAVTAVALRPDPAVSVSAWAAESRYVAPEASTMHHGKWSNDLVPYLVEPMDCLSLSDPCLEVVVKKSAQLGFTEAGINMFGTIATRTPAPMLIVLPTVDTASKWVKTKLEPAIEVSPTLKAAIREKKSRDEDGSTSRFKRFAGGFAIITGANSSADLKTWSVRVVIFEEVSEYPADVDNAGDPVELAIARTKAVSEFRKLYFNSTPGLKASCRISIRYEASDQRRYYVPCPHCDDFHVLTFDNMDWASDQAPYGAFFVCPSCGSTIESHHRRSMVSAGVWLKTYPGEDAPPDIVAPADVERYRTRSSAGRAPGFAIWQAYSPFVAWDYTVAEYLRAQGAPAMEKVFTQQALGEAWEETGEGADPQKLTGRLEAYPVRIMPPGCLFTTLGADVQGNRIEWAVWGWGIGKTSWLIDKGVIEGDTSDLTTFRPLSEIVMRSYENSRGASWPIEASAIDAGFNTQTVYAWVRMMAPRVIAVKGMPGHWAPPLGTPRQQAVTYRGTRSKFGVLLWGVGTWTLKAEFYANLRKTVEGPREDGSYPFGYVHMPMEIDEDYLRQLTAEELVTRTVGRLLVQEWVNPPGRRNEALDIRIYAAAAAVHVGIDAMTPAQWLELAARRGADPERSQMELALWSQGIVTPSAPPPPSTPVEPARQTDAAPSRNWVEPVAGDWIGERKSWL